MVNKNNLFVFVLDYDISNFIDTFTKNTIFDSRFDLLFTQSDLETLWSDINDFTGQVEEIKFLCERWNSCQADE
jgi:hypothetical protein